MCSRIFFLIFVSWCSVAVAEGWHEVQRSGHLTKGAVYCEDLDDLKAFLAFAQDGDARGADRLVSEGGCVIVQNSLKVDVFREDGMFAYFFAPSGKGFFTLPALIE